MPLVNFKYTHNNSKPNTLRPKPTPPYLSDIMKPMVSQSPKRYSPEEDGMRLLLKELIKSANRHPAKCVHLETLQFVENNLAELILKSKGF